MQASGSQPEMGTGASQFFWHLLTVGMILAALAFPFYIQGNGDGWLEQLNQFNFFNNGSVAESSAEQDGGKATDGTTGLAANSDLDGTTEKGSDSELAANPDLAPAVDPSTLASDDSTSIAPKAMTNLAANTDSQTATDGDTDSDPGTITTIIGITDPSSSPLPTTQTDSGTAAETQTVAGPETTGATEGTKNAWVSVDSSDIAAVRHNLKTKQLDIKFKDGRIYQYADVPKKVYDGLMKANSHGRFFAKKIKNAGYEVKKLK